MRTGIPMASQPSRVEYRVSVLIETKDGRAIYKNWVGASVRRIHHVARARYKQEFPGCRVSFGTATSENYYGAH